MNYSPKERAIMELAWNNNEDFNVFCSSFFRKNKNEIRKLAASEIRIPTSLVEMETYKTRKCALRSLTVDSILESSPTAYIGSKYKEGPYSSLSFRSWHFVSHTNFDIPNIQSTSDATWIYIVKAIGSKSSIHYHGLVEFVFAHPKDYVLNELNLPKDSLFVPIHNSFLAAKEYLDNQAIQISEQGIIPSHQIWVDEKEIEIPERLKYIAACEGEDPVYTSAYRKQYPRRRCEEYIKWLTNQEFTRKIIKAESIDKALSIAENESKLFNLRIFKLNCKGILAPFINEIPPNYGGEHVAILLNLPSKWEKLISLSSWISSIPVIIYTQSE